MHKNPPKCFKRVGNIICPHCKQESIKYGKSKSNKQRYQCKACSKVFLEEYTYKSYEPQTNFWIVNLTKEGCGIRSTARLLQISTTTLLKRLLQISNAIPRPLISKYKTYEVDELCTYIKKKSRKIWIVYALERSTKSVVSLAVGRRTSNTLSTVVQTLLNAETKAIYTDRLRQYASLIPAVTSRFAPTLNDLRGGRFVFLKVRLCYLLS